MSASSNSCQHITIRKHLTIIRHGGAGLWWQHLRGWERMITSLGYTVNSKPAWAYNETSKTLSHNNIFPNTVLSSYLCLAFLGISFNFSHMWPSFPNREKHGRGRDFDSVGLFSHIRTVLILIRGTIKEGDTSRQGWCNIEAIRDENSKGERTGKKL